MSGVPRHLIEHSLNVSKTARPIKQKLQQFTCDKKVAIRIEVTQLLAAGFIKEVYHPDWLANLVLVRKKIMNRECALTTLILTNTVLRTPLVSLVLTRWLTLRLDVNFSLSSIATLVITRSH
jgi:hypothetical protein